MSATAGVFMSHISVGIARVARGDLRSDRSGHAGSDRPYQREWPRVAVRVAARDRESGRMMVSGAGRDGKKVAPGAGC